NKMYEKKPFPDAEIYYFSNGMYKIISQGENHYGVYVMQGTFDDQTYTIRFISLPSEDWGNKTAFHQLTFVRGDKQNVFIQNAIVDTGEAIAQQNGTYTLEKNTVSNPVPTSWKHD
ncbi:hypothetical protein FQJ95_25175, partial [Xanthomonas vasicola]